MVATTFISNEESGLTLAWGMTIVILLLESYDETVSSSLDINYCLAKYNRILASKNRDLGDWWPRRLSHQQEQT